MYFCKLNIPILSFEFFIAKRILPNQSQDIKVSRPILRIAVISISLSIVVNLVSFAIVTGFKNEIRRKVTGFSAPLFIQNINNADFYESDPIQRSPKVEAIISQNPDVLGINSVAYKPGMLQANNESHDVLGIVFKGIDTDFDPTFLKEHLIAGKIPDFKSNENSDDLVLSSKMCQQLGLRLHDEVLAMFVKNEPITRRFQVIGIYNTGFDDYDSKLALCDIKVVQKLNDWGISGQLEVGDSLVNDQIPIILTLQGNSQNLLFDWGKGPGLFRGQIIPKTTKDTLIKVNIVQRTKNEISIIDEHSIHVTYEKDTLSDMQEFYKEGLNSSGSKYRYHMPISAEKERIFNVEVMAGNGTSSNYLSGYEIRTNDWNMVESTLAQLKKQLELIPTESDELVKVISIYDLEHDLFKWLAFLDINVQIILTLMLLIGIINMGSALLIIIIIRSNFIGLMKTFGASNRSLRRIFLIQAGYLILRGMLLGNGVALAIYFLQRQTGILTLNPEVYYLSEVPMELNFLTFILLNVGTFVLCILALMVPSIIIARVNPIKTIRFN